MILNCLSRGFHLPLPSPFLTRTHSFSKILFSDFSYIACVVPACMLDPLLYVELFHGKSSMTEGKSVVLGGGKPWFQVPALWLQPFPTFSFIIHAVYHVMS